ncbi:unnamed protein product [Closterium sp. NIES-53]
MSLCIDREGAIREAWKRIEGEHVSKSLHSKIQACLEFFTVRMKDGESMRAYVNRVEKLGERSMELDASVEDNDCDDNWRAHVVTCDNNDREFVFVASGTTVGGVDAWVLDTGATQHMMACATLLNNVTTVAPVKRMMFGNHDTLDVTGQGDLRLMVDSGPLTIKNVLVVPGLGANLLSVSQLTRKGMRGNIEGTRMALSTVDGVHSGTARQAGGLFVLQALPSVASAQAASSTTTFST